MNADKRTNNVRNTSANNVNVNNNNVNVNKNVNGNANGNNNNNCCNNGWDNDYHPLATAAAVTATVGGHRLDGAHRTGQLRSGELRRHGLSAVRQHLVPAARIAVHDRQSALLTPRPSTRCGSEHPARGLRAQRTLGMSIAGILE